MREHIYKAKRIDNGEWVEGLPIRSHIGFNSRIDTIQYAFGGYLPTYKIDPKTLCEYTGLKDKNGNKIFENDIVKGSVGGREHIGICEYNNKIGGYVFGNKVTSIYGKTLVNNMRFKNKEIIGNIFDNKELL